VVEKASQIINQPLPRVTIQAKRDGTIDINVPKGQNLRTSYELLFLAGSGLAQETAKLDAKTQSPILMPRGPIAPVTPEAERAAIKFIRDKKNGGA